MTIQNFNLYTENGYEGDLVDSGPRVVQTGVLVGGDAGFGKVMSRETSVERGVQLGGASGNIYAISQRELNHESASRPSTGEDFKYLETQSVSLIRQGYLYVLLTGTTPITQGVAMHFDSVLGTFTKDAVAGDVVACTNVFADEDAIVGDVLKVRIDIVAG